MTLNRPLERLFTIWSGLPRQTHPHLPARRSLVLSSLADILPRISLLHRESRYGVTANLIGTTVDALWGSPNRSGASLAGINVFDLAAPCLRETAADLYDAVLMQPCGLVLKEHVKKSARSSLEVTTLFLPMTDRRGLPAYILGCTSFEVGKAGNTLCNHVISSARQLSDVHFLDLGLGTPTLELDLTQFADMAARKPHKPIQAWWQRLLPAREQANRGSGPSLTPALMPALSPIAPSPIAPDAPTDSIDDATAAAPHSNTRESQPPAITPTHWPKGPMH